LCNLAERADRLDWSRPQLCDEPLIEIDDGRHPVVEQVGASAGASPSSPTACASTISAGC
jgi:hypothetical protein